MSRSGVGGPPSPERAAGHKGTFVTARAKLFFVLFYFKCYPLQEVMSVLFGVSQGQVSHWVGVLTPQVNEALGRELLLWNEYHWNSVAPPVWN